MPVVEIGDAAVQPLGGDDGQRDTRHAAEANAYGRTAEQASRARLLDLAALARLLPPCLDPKQVAAIEQPCAGKSEEEIGPCNRHPFILADVQAVERL